MLMGRTACLRYCIKGIFLLKLGLYSCVKSELLVHRDHLKLWPCLIQMDTKIRNSIIKQMVNRLLLIKHLFIHLEHLSKF